MRDDAVIIEVGLNEAVSLAQHRHVAHSPADCAADAIRCADAGASLVHWHAVDATGAQRLDDVALYGEALDALATSGATSGSGHVLAYPSYRTDVADTVDEKVAHCIALRARHGLEIAPVDVVTVNLVLLDDARTTIAPLEPIAGFDVIRNSLPFVADALARYAAVGLIPTLAAFDLGGTRTIAALADTGLLATPFLCKIFLWNSPLIGPTPSVEALDLHLRELPDDLDCEWSVVSYGMTDPASIAALAIAALERGGGVRVGIGDSPRANPDVSNAALVEQVVGWATKVGRPIATPDDVRERLGIGSVKAARST